MAVDRRSNIEALIQKIVRLQTEINDLLGETVRPELRPGASPDRIDQVESSFGFKLPPTYRQFLQLHDGCKSFTGAFDLLGTQDILGPYYADRVRRIRDAEWASGNRVPVEGFVIGYGEESSYALLIDRTAEPDAAGELPVVLWEYEQVARAPSFEAFLAFWVDVDEKRVAHWRNPPVEEDDADQD